MRVRTVRRAAARTAPAVRAVALAALVGALLSGCSLFGSADKNASHSISVFLVRPGQCFTAQTSVKAELSSLNEVPCTSPHTQESYAVVSYAAAGSVDVGPSASASGGAYPGGDVLDKFAKGVCAQRFSGYVGIDYLDSSLYFTYLLPSARSWEQDDDRNVLCFVTTTGATLTTSVKDSRK